MTTLKDLSRHLGLSVTQVSRALNGHADVSAATKARVAAAAAELGYRTNVSARMLKSGRSGIVGMVVSGRDEQATPDTFLELIVGLSEEFARRRMQFILHALSRGDDAVAAHRQLSAAGLIDGFIVLNPVPDDPRIADLTARGVPFVVHGRDRPAPDYAFADIDNAEVGRRLTGELAAAGHRRIAFLNGPEGRAFAAAREAGAHAGADGAALVVRHSAMLEAEGRRAVQELCAGPAAAPTGIACGNMMLAAGVLEALAGHGLAVPGAVSVIAHDDGLGRVPPDTLPVALARTLAPLAEARAALAEALLRRIEGAPLEECQTLLPIRFAPGESVAAPPVGANGNA